MTGPGEHAPSPPYSGPEDEWGAASITQHNNIDCIYVGAEDLGEPAEILSEDHDESSELWDDEYDDNDDVDDRRYTMDE